MPCFYILGKIPALLGKKLKFPNEGALSIPDGDFIFNVEKLSFGTNPI